MYSFALYFREAGLDGSLNGHAPAHAATKRIPTKICSLSPFLPGRGLDGSEPI